MTYNIIKWKTKEILDLRVPLDAIYNPENDEPPIIRVLETGKLAITINLCETGQLTGLLQVPQKIIDVLTLSLRGEFSGSAYTDRVKYALSQSTGLFVAVMVWEDGSLLRFESIEGQLIETDIEL